MERMSEEEFINNVEGHITSLKNLDNKALKILVGRLEEENKKLRHENRYRAGIVDILPKGKGHIAEETIQDLQAIIKELKEKNEKLEEDNINLISFNEHYSPDVIVKYEDRYETAYNEECIENAKLCDKMRRLEEENKKLKEELGECQCSMHFENDEVGYGKRENKKLKEENENLKAIIEHYKKFEEGKEKLEGMLMEEDTPQELRDLGKI